jgi:hypothetical protein
MILLSSAVIVVVILYWAITRQPRRQSAWRTALHLGLPAGIVRASLACGGWYVVEHTGGPLQIPAYVLAMFSWPEAALLPRSGPMVTPAGTYVLLFALLVVSTTMFVALLAAIARGRASVRHDVHGRQG